MNLTPLLKYNNMTVRQLAVLQVLYTTGDPMMLRDIAMKLKVPRPSISRAFDGLWRAKMLVRRRSEEDRRDMFGMLTEKGKKLIEEVGK
jgi:DNA-binding MarR family transcriptional regulator